jgi:hypothetical protein
MFFLKSVFLAQNCPSLPGLCTIQRGGSEKLCNSLVQPIGGPSSSGLTSPLTPHVQPRHFLDSLTTSGTAVLTAGIGLRVFEPLPILESRLHSCGSWEGVNVSKIGPSHFFWHTPESYHGKGAEPGPDCHSRSLSFVLAA